MRTYKLPPPQPTRGYGHLLGITNLIIPEFFFKYANDTDRLEAELCIHFGKGLQYITNSSTYAEDRQLLLCRRHTLHALGCKAWTQLHKRYLSWCMQCWVPYNKNWRHKMWGSFLQHGNRTLQNMKETTPTQLFLTTSKLFVIFIVIVIIIIGTIIFNILYFLYFLIFFSNLFCFFFFLFCLFFFHKKC